MTSQETALVLRHKRTGTSAENCDFRLDVLNVIVVGLEIDLRVPLVFGVEAGASRRFILVHV